MPGLGFRVQGVVTAPFAAVPQFVLGFRVTKTPATEAIHSVALRCQLRLEPAARTYSPEERAKLVELFGEPSRWGETLRGMLWTHAAVMVPPFAGEAAVEL